MLAQSSETSSLAVEATADCHDGGLVSCGAGLVAAYGFALGGLAHALWRGLAKTHWGFAVLHMTGRHRGTPVNQGMGQGRITPRQKSSGLMPGPRVAFCDMTWVVRI